MPQNPATSTPSHNCQLCNEPDIPEMVQCDKCDLWYHFACVGVSSAVADVSWKCEGCSANVLGQQQVNPPLASNLQDDVLDDKSSISSQSAGKKKQLLLQRLEEEKLLRDKSNQLYLQQKYEILAQDSDDEEEYDASHCHQPRQQQHHKTEQQQAKTNDEEIPVPPHVSKTFQLSSTQLAARHAIPKDLPVFSGNPEEWPVFISCYEQSTDLAGFSNGENLVRLQKCLRGKAMEAVKHRLMLPTMVPDVIRTLRMLFGRPEHIIHALITKAKNMTPPKAEKLESVIEFALAIKNVCATLEATNLTAHLNNPMLLKEFVDKLSPHLLLTWAVFSKNLQPATLVDFSNWLYDIAEAACSVTTLPVTPACEKRPTSSTEKRTPKSRGFLNTHGVANRTNNSAQPVRNYKECGVCQGDHLVVKCGTFTNASLSERWEMLRQYNLCRSCLGRHPYSRCRASKICEISGCQAKHHPLLHNYAKSTPATSDALTNAGVFTHEAHTKFTKVLFRILPVTLYGNGKSVDTFAFLDGGSSLTLLDEELVSKLGLSGRTEELCLRWTSDTTRTESSSQIVSLGIAGRCDGSRKYQLNNVRTVRRLDLPTQTVSNQMLAKQYPYLADLPIPSYQQAQPRILIGMDNWKLGVPLKVFEGSWSQPIVAKTRLGWSVHGPDTCNKNEDTTDSSRLLVCECNADRELHQLVSGFFSIENVGIRIPTQQIVSAEEKRATKILEDTCLRIDGHFEVGLLWKFDDISLPNSLPMARRRFHHLQKRIGRDEELRSNLDQQITNLVAKGYARKLTIEEMNIRHDRVWYLPIFIVRNPNKPSKVRLVWDAAAKCNGTSLNDFLLKGPDQLVLLTTVLCGFRCGKIGICGDIAEMFHQVRVREADRHVQRFLWSAADDLQNPSVFEMNVMTFGAACSPCIAHYVKNRNATSFVGSKPRAVEAVLEHHYVDDFIDSVNTEAEAIQLAEDVKYIHQNAGFHIRNWMSNSAAVRAALEGDSDGPHNKAFGVDETASTEKVLGLYWFTSADAFTFVLKFNRLKRDVLSEGAVPTKREILQILMSVFDPMGFLSHFLICIKVLLQEIWREPIGWDDELPASMVERWLQWRTLLHNVTKVRVPRCYSKLLSQANVCVQLHTFVDASENAYAAVSYFRIECQDNIDVAIVCAEAKVAPQRPISVPRLELQAAVLGTRLTSFICSSHKFAIKQRFLWTDSKTVLAWLRGDPRKFQQFVMFRVGEILDASQISEWRWVPSKLNIADKATKWKSPPEFHATSEWFSGPVFLRYSHTEWPQSPTIDSTNEEVRPSMLHITETSTSCVIDDSRFSKWAGMYRSLAYAITFIEILRFRVKGKHTVSTGLTSEMIRRSQAALYRQAQFAAYSDEIALLQRSQSLEKAVRLSKGSPLAKLSPFLDADGVLKMRGRIALAHCVHESCKTPVILPKLHRITFLIIDSYHRKYHHCNHETVLNEIRQKYYIANLRTLLKSVRQRCQLCKIQTASPIVPEMASLPIARMSAFSRPFSFVGLDYFGPILVTVGRRSEKRWGVIFTCLTIRAVHIELAHSLTTDSCIICLKNFIARRGTPLEIYCDNGTNFRGAERELQEELAKINLDQVANEFTTADTKWKFNPPSAPHMGGAWERLVRSIKSVLYRILPSNKVGEETLRSALAEVENTVNARPLTFVSLDSTEDEALTPNHFILGTSNGSKPSCDVYATDLRRNWKYSQTIAEVFWKKWIKAYLPNLNRRAKWFQKVKPIEKGDLVIIVDEHLPRNCWPRGVVVNTVIAQDGQVRRATVRTSSGLFERPAAKLAVLDVRPSGDWRSNTNLKGTSDPFTGGSVAAT